jgi:AcrR family transcriptional regulator
MTRPSRNTDRRLIDAAKELIPKTGFSGLKVRDVADKAGVNLGMFSYHFKTKDKFIEVLLAEIYEEFFSGFQLEVGRGANAKEQLRHTMLTIARFLRDHRDLVLPLVEEIFLGNRHIMAFARKNMTRHIGILIKLVKKGQKEGYIVKLPLLNVLPVLMGAILAPVFVIGVLNKFSQKGLLPGLVPMTINSIVMTDKALEQRIDIALKGLSA